MVGGIQLINMSAGTGGGPGRVKELQMVVQDQPAQRGWYACRPC